MKCVPGFTRVGLLLLAMPGVASLAAPGVAEACDCVLPSVAAARDESVAVFEGRVTAIEDGEASAGTKRVTLALVRTWKGLENKEVAIVSASALSANCGSTLVRDTSYLVYASGDESNLAVSSCSRTRTIQDASEDLAVLGVGVTPVDVPVQPKAAHAPVMAPHAAGCGSTHASSRGTASLLLMPVTGLALGVRRRGKRR